jgi:Zn-finger domain-containing protein
MFIKYPNKEEHIGFIENSDSVVIEAILSVYKNKKKTHKIPSLDEMYEFLYKETDFNDTKDRIISAIGSTEIIINDKQKKDLNNLLASPDKVKSFSYCSDKKELTINGNTMEVTSYTKVHNKSLLIMSLKYLGSVGHWKNLPRLNTVLEDIKYDLADITLLEDNSIVIRGKLNTTVFRYVSAI